jgi:zinc transporter ZupT
MAALITGFGIFAISRYQRWGRENSLYFMSFAAGILISVSFLHILPRAMAMTGQGPVFYLGGFLIIYLTNRSLHLYLHEAEEDIDHRVGLVPMFGIGLHSFVDGMIFAVTFNVDVFTGAVAALGMVLHEIPEGVITYITLKRGGFQRRKAGIYAFLAAGLTTPAAAIITYPFLHEISQTTLGSLLALSGGALTYVGATHLLPRVQRGGRRFTLATLLAGIAMGALIISVGAG